MTIDLRVFHGGAYHFSESGVLASSATSTTIKGLRNMFATRFSALRGSVAATTLLLFALPVAAQIQEQTYRFDLPTQSLGSALRSFAQSSRQQVIFAEDSVRGLQAPALIGSYTAEEGLRLLLSGSDLTVGRTPSGVLFVGAEAGTSDNEPQSGVTSSAQDLAGVVVTGSRIRRTDTATAAPVTVLDEVALTERGYVSMGELLNQVTSNTPFLPVSPSSGFPAGNGKTSPNLFNLGVGRTLTLMNGRRMVTSSSGLGDRTVDTNVIPTGLIQRVDIVQAGGAAVYGSDAIAGVVNYVLKDNYEGLELDAQYGESSLGDNPKSTFRATYGTNFMEGRGNIAFNLEYSKTRPLLEHARRVTSEAARTVTNPANTSSSDGIPSTMYVFGSRFWQQNRDGVIFGMNSATPGALLRLDGSALQFASDGLSVVPYDPGEIQGNSSTAIGGDGLDVRDNSSLVAGVERWSGTVIGHFDLTDQVRVSGEFVYGRQIGRDPYGTQQIFRQISIPGGAAGAVAFNRDNPFLTPEAIASLSAASPGFASGGNLYLSRFFDILPTRERYAETDTWRGLLDVSGDFQARDRHFYWSVSASRGRTDGTATVWAPYYAHMANALSSVRNGAGDIVCAINADAIATNDDPACVPLNPFGSNGASQAARDYVSVLSGQNYANVQDDYLATLGGDLINLPGGMAQFSVAYEHRRETVQFRPFEADLLGLSSLGTRPINRDGSYHTNEYSGELLLPLLGGDFTLPGVSALEASASYRLVENSIAGKERVWGAGLRWDTGYGVSFRGSVSRNFRAPTLDQLFAPTSSATGQPLGADPCDADRINAGPSPATRLANCQAEWAANPGYGPLEGFQDPAENTGIVTITSGGNPDLRNEVSKTTTAGLVFQPGYIPGLTFTADRIEVKLTDGLSAFSPASFAATCYDSSPQPADICATFTRNSLGHITAGRSTTYNAGKVHFRGEVYNFNYRFPVGRFFEGRDLGVLEFALEATHTSRLLTSVTGFDRSESQGTTATPDWRVRGDLRYSRGPVRLFYSVYYLPSVKSGFNDTIETTPVPVIDSNYTHTVSGQFDYRNITFRAGVNNLTNETPSFPTRSYGDLFGRQYFVGARVRF